MVCMVLTFHSLLFCHYILLQQPDESFGMNVAGGMGGQVGDLPVYISAIRPESAVAKSGRIQVSGIVMCKGGRKGGGEVWKNGG